MLRRRAGLAALKMSMCTARFETRGEVIAMVFEYIRIFYNLQHSTLGYKSPMQFLSDWLTAQQQEKLVA